MLWGLERSLKEIVVYVPTNWSTHATIFCKEIQKKMSIDDDPITIRVVQLRSISLHLILVYFLPLHNASISLPKVNVFIIGSAYPNFNTGVGIL